MEQSMINLQSADTIIEYRDTCRLNNYETDLIAEMLRTIAEEDSGKLYWFNRFGESLRQIISNVHTYRKQTEFGY